MSAMRLEELSSNAKQPTLTKLASAPVTMNSADVGTAADGSSGVPESIATTETVSMITTMISRAKNSLGMPAVKSKRARSTNEVNSGKPGMRNSTAAMKPGETTLASGSTRSSSKNADEATNDAAIVMPIRLKCALCRNARTSWPSIAARHTSAAVASPNWFSTANPAQASPAANVDRQRPQRGEGMRSISSSTASMTSGVR